MEYSWKNSLSTEIQVLHSTSLVIPATPVNITTYYNYYYYNHILKTTTLGTAAAESIHTKYPFDQGGGGNMLTQYVIFS